jgi:hypothetical protein
MYIENYDINRDNIIHMIDVAIFLRKFSKTPDDYE